MNLYSNLLNNYNSLFSDFIGFSINLTGMSDFLLHMFIAGSIFVVYYLFGEKLRKLLFKEQKEFVFLVNIVLGYISIGTGIAILGIFSLLRAEIIWTYLIVITLIAYYPFTRREIKFPKVNYKDFVMGGVILFVLISFLRLMTPEIAEDGYHTDLPNLYLASQTMMHESKEMLHVIPYPQLPEMMYLIPLFLGDREAARFIHFGFYLLIIVLLFQIAKRKDAAFARYAPLLFVTAPLAIRYSSSQYTDFFMLLPFLLSFLLIKKNMSHRTIILSGILFGAVISAKIWMLIYLPAFLLFLGYIKRKEHKKKVIYSLCMFALSALSIVSIWYIRAYLLTGYPLYPIFAHLEYLEINAIVHPQQFSYFGINLQMFAPQNMAVLSPLFFLGVLFCVLHIKKVSQVLGNSPAFLFFAILSLEQILIKVDLGRYLFAWFTTASIIISAGFVHVMSKSKLVTYGVSVFIGIIFLYYFINTLLILPYGFGWADRNTYLTRVLGRDNVSYYDFDQLFDKHISDKDLVATYGIGSFYYGDFAYLDIGYVFSMRDRSFDLLKKKKVTKLLIKGGDLKWFCKTLALTQCNSQKVMLLATYPADVKKYNLYLLK